MKNTMRNTQKIRYVTIWLRIFHIDRETYNTHSHARALDQNTHTHTKRILIILYNMSVTFKQYWLNQNGTIVVYNVFLESSYRFCFASGEWSTFTSTHVYSYKQFVGMALVDRFYLRIGHVFVCRRYLKIPTNSWVGSAWDCILWSCRHCRFF